MRNLVPSVSSRTLMVFVILIIGRHLQVSAWTKSTTLTTTRRRRKRSHCPSVSSAQVVTSAAVDEVEWADKLTTSFPPDENNAHGENPITTVSDWWQRGRMFQQSHDLARAAAALQKAVEATAKQGTPLPLELLFDLGEIWSRMGYVELGVEMYEKILRRLDNNASNVVVATAAAVVAPLDDNNNARLQRRTKVALATVLLDGLGRKQDALALLTNVCGKTRPSPLAVLAGMAADSLGDRVAAEAWYQQGYLDEADMDAETALHLACSRLRRGDEAGAAPLRGRLLDHVASSLDYVLSTPVALQPSMHYFTYDMIQLALQHVTMTEGLILEFGVYHGKTIRMIANHFLNATTNHNTTIVVHGFDTFTGIPHDWHATPRGSYSTHGTLPAAPANVQYHVGTFAATLPAFLRRHQHQPIRFLNIDCDLYQSTVDIFDAVHGRIVPGTIILFDEYLLNPHWQDDEYRAFQQAVQKYNWQYEYLALSLASQQAVVRIL